MGDRLVGNKTAVLSDEQEMMLNLPTILGFSPGLCETHYLHDLFMIYLKIPTPNELETGKG